MAADRHCGISSVSNKNVASGCFYWINPLTFRPMRSRGRSTPGVPRALTALLVGVLATIAALRLFISSPAQVTATDEILPGQIESPLPEDSQAAEAAPEAITISMMLDRTAPVTTYLENAGIERDEARRWASVFQSAAATKLLQRDHFLTIYKDPETGELRGLKYDLDLKTTIMVANLGNMVIKAGTLPIEYYTKPVQMAFVVNEDFKRAAVRHGVPTPIVDSLLDAFSGRRALDHLKPGSGVKLIYQEKISRDGTYHLVGDVEAAQIRFGSRTLSAYAFRDEHGTAHLYDENGRALGPQYLRFPVNFQYISSGFTFHRYHPLLHTYRPHVGVDLVAQYGTPVRAVADGKVEQAGWAGELGNAIRIDHQHGTTSIYGHLSRISPDVRPDAWVHMGQVIGWVGSTGLSTGPHLHFALEREGNYVNPLTEKLGVNHQVSPRMRALFDDLRERYETALAKLPDIGGRLTPVEEAGSGGYHVAVGRADRGSSRRRSRRGVTPANTVPAESSTREGAL
jgi:murein DD-endopeptidase MepM/ murein hydrolase activator NlpD